MDMDKKDYVEERLNHFRPFKDWYADLCEGTTCHTEGHENVPAAWVAIHAEEGFSEYSGFCQECYEEAKRDIEDEFDAILNGTLPEEEIKTFECERCHAVLRFFEPNTDGKTIKSNWRNYIDPEDKSWMDSCDPCHSKMTRDYLRYIEDEFQD